MPDPVERERVTSDGNERQRRADALRVLAERTQPEPSAAHAKSVTPLRGAPGGWRRPRVWGSVALIGVVIVAVVVATLWRGPASAGAPSAAGSRSVLRFPFKQIACPESESWSPDGKTLAVVGFFVCGPQGETQIGTDPVVALFNMATGRISATFDLQSVMMRGVPAHAQLGDVGEATWSTDGRYIGVPFFFSTSDHPGVYGLVALGANDGSTRVIAPTIPVAKAGVTYDRYSTNSVMPPLTVRFDLTTGSASPLTLPPAYAYTWKGPDILTPAPLSGQPVVSTETLPASVSGSLTYFCAAKAGVSASYLLNAGGGAWSPDDRYFYSTLGAYGIVSGAKPVSVSKSGVASAPACATIQPPTGWRQLAAPLNGLEGGERDFQQIANGNALLFATCACGARIAVVESDNTTSPGQGTQTTTAIRVYDGATGERQAQFSLQQLIQANHIHPQQANTSSLQQIAWSPDGHSLALLDTLDLAIIIIGPAQLHSR
ncbi:MAG TPA: hypothetical protein VFQ25_12550 [Ktedonobacterales bacterium]|nr:hypothetical protein [Ktedonobacterales bacterium]